MSVSLRPLSALGLCLFAACSTPRYYDQYRFSPAPLEAQVASEADPDVQVRALVSVIGVARAREGRPAAIDVRMRLENLGRQPAELVEESLSLVTADLHTFGPARVESAQGPTIPPGGSALYDLSFPLPEGRKPRDINLRGLNLRWALSFAGREVTTGASFTRDERVRGYHEPSVHFGFGVGTHIH